MSSVKRSSGYSSSTTNFRSARDQVSFAVRAANEPHCTRTKLRPPPLGIELLFRPSGVFELTVDVDEDWTDLAHGCTSTNHGTRDVNRVPTIAEGLGRPRGYGV